MQKKPKCKEVYKNIVKTKPRKPEGAFMDNMYKIMELAYTNEKLRREK